MTDPAPFQEPARLAALQRLDLLDTAPEPGFDDIVVLARTITGAPVALISLIDAERQWFKAKAGTDLAETPRSVAFCDRTIRQDGVLVSLDASRDPRFAENPLVTGDPHIRFYAGAPIHTPDGFAIGTVCVLGPEPRTYFDQGDALQALARQAAASIELRRRFHLGREAEAAATRDRDRLWTLAHDIILVCDLEGIVLAANPAWQEVFGPLDQPGATMMRNFLVDKAQRPVLSDIVDGAGVTSVHDYRDCRNETRTISWTLRREGELIYGIGRDDTALRAAQAELMQAQKMESLGQLTGGIAHDFNNLLTIIIGNLDIASRRLAQGDGARVERAIGEAQEGATRAATLTQRLLAFARRQRLAPRAIDPGILLADMRSLIEGAVNDRIAIEIIVEAGIWPIEIDAGQLENAVINLAVNSRDAMAADGALLLSLANRTVEDKDAERHGVAAGDFVRLTIADTGTGISEDILARVFEPFFTTKGVGRGTGLGLSQVDGFVRQSGGFVTLDTRVGEGTSVHLWLPRGSQMPAASTMQLTIAEPAARITTVLVVEDNDALRELVVETLRGEGYRVLEAHDGQSALTLFGRQTPAPELVISDVMMPRLDGFALAAEIRVRAPQTRILLMSGYAGHDAPSRVDGDDPLLVKPFTLDLLLDRVKAMLAV